jgi:hypothetical protein
LVTGTLRRFFCLVHGAGTAVQMVSLVVMCIGFGSGTPATTPVLVIVGKDASLLAFVDGARQ